MYVFSHQADWRNVAGDNKLVEFVIGWQIKFRWLIQSSEHWCAGIFNGDVATRVHWRMSTFDRIANFSFTKLTKDLRKTHTSSRKLVRCYDNKDNAGLVAVGHGLLPAQKLLAFWVSMQAPREGMWHELFRGCRNTEEVKEWSRLIWLRL